MGNRLQKEKSPYLLQHAGNPVDWYPWSEAVFKSAKSEGKPVFLSIGYATCHWCHVMARESFEDPHVAELMNRHFVNIKVDREERPDIDHTYMTVCQLLTGQGGWPLNVLLTPDKRPFFAATYIPRESRFGRIGMIELLPRIAEAWEREREKVEKAADRLSDGFVRAVRTPDPQKHVPAKDRILTVFDELSARFDNLHGGFGDSPKFPSPHNLLFLMRFQARFDDPGAERMIRLTLEEMRLGGICDQIGGGFHRYSTDERWHLPHFEKMLGDQAMLMLAYAEGWRMCGDELFRKTVIEIEHYLEERMRSPEGGFFSAEDADSEGEEGLYYLWSTEELRSVPDLSDPELWIRFFSMKEEGNYPDEASGRLTGKNVLDLCQRPESFADGEGIGRDRFEERFKEVKEKLKKFREKRPAPSLDDKVLADWNGLAIAGLARASALLNRPSLLEKAQTAWTFIRRRLISGNDSLLHRYRDGEAGIDAMADDYAFLVWAGIELYQSSLNPDYLDQALQLNERFLELFLDTDRGGFFFTAEGREVPIARQKQIYDGALPSSNSVAAMNLIRLARLTGRTELEEAASNLFDTLSGLFDETPGNVTFLALSLDMALHGGYEAVICGDPNDSKTASMIRLLHQQPFGTGVYLLKTPKNARQLAVTAPFTESLPLSEKSGVWVCSNFRCEAPIHSIEKLRQKLRQISSGSRQSDDSA